MKFLRVLVKKRLDDLVFLANNHIKKGLHHVFEIPSYTDSQLSGYQCLQEVPAREGCWV